MNYATWKLNFTDPNYGTGPEDEVQKSGISIESAWADGTIEEGATILGYLTSPANEASLTKWHFLNLSEEDALAFCLNVNPKAYLLPNGRFGVRSEG
jgi:hypothetical protein